MSTNTQMTQDSVTHRAKPGLCVIIQQDTYQDETELKDPSGYRQDVKSLCVTFWKFGFDIRVYVDLTAEKLTQTMEDLAKEKGNSIFKGYASLVVCILSHGGLETVYGIDGKAVNIKDLQWEFSTEQCPELNGKPKVFFIHQDADREDAAAELDKEPKNGDNNSPPLSDVIQMMCRAKVYSELGTNFMQGLCFHLPLVNLDIKEAYNALYKQELNKPPNSNNSNTFPLYLPPRRSNKMVVFKTVPPADRCTQIYFYGKNSTISSYQDLAKFITEKFKDINLKLIDAFGQVSTSSTNTMIEAKTDNASLLTDERQQLAVAKDGLPYWLFKNQQL